MTTVTVQPWILTFTKRKVNPLDVQPDDICIEDIAHALACTNRFNGHTKAPWSVAQHSVGAALLVNPQHALQALLHDASEAYLGDVTKWLKMSPAMAFYREVEWAMQRAIYQKFGCALDDAPEVIDADRFMVRLEATDGYDGQWQTGLPEYAPVSDWERRRLGPWRPWTWQNAERQFLKLFEEVGRA